MNVVWGLILAIPMRTALTQMAATTVCAWMALKAMDLIAQVS